MSMDIAEKAVATAASSSALGMVNGVLMVAKVISTAASLRSLSGPRKMALLANSSEDEAIAFICKRNSKGQERCCHTCSKGKV